MTHIDKMQIVKIESGRADVRFTTLCRLSTAFSVTLHDLIPIATNSQNEIDAEEKEW